MQRWCTSGQRRSRHGEHSRSSTRTMRASSSELAVSSGKFGPITDTHGTGGSGPMNPGSSGAGEVAKGPVSRAQGRFTIATDGEILTNNSEDGAAPHPIGRQLHWDVSTASNKIPEALIRL